MAEKKSTKAKSTRKKTVLKAEETRPADQIKPQEINWNSGIIIALVPLVITSTLFMIGWAYVSNWYAFFGIGVEQINIPLQEILIHSLPAITRAIYLLATSTIVFVISRTIYFFIFIPREKIKLFEKKIFRPIEKSEWYLIFTLATFLNYAISLITALIPDIDILFKLQTKIPLINYPMPVEADFLAALLISAFLIFIVSQVIDAMLDSYKNGGYKDADALREMIKELELDDLKAEVTKHFSKNDPFNLYEKIDRRVWQFLALFVFLASILQVSASVAYSSASTGKKIQGGHVRKVLLVAPIQITPIQAHELACDKAGMCTYGPFGLVAENQTSFFLTDWDETYPGNFRLNPSLYIIPHNDSKGAYLIIPADSTQAPKRIPLVDEKKIAVPPPTPLP